MSKNILDKSKKNGIFCQFSVRNFGFFDKTDRKIQKFWIFVNKL